MILFVIVSRLDDGLPLSACTDFGNNAMVVDSQKVMKLVCKRAKRFPDRAIYNSSNFSLYILSGRNVCIQVSCSCGYPTVFAFSFLQELLNDFIFRYSPEHVREIKRSYSLIEFDTVISKLKRKYSSPTNQSFRPKLNNLADELKARPPETLDDVALGLRYARNQTQQSGDGPQRKSSPTANGVAISLHPAAVSNAVPGGFTTHFRPSATAVPSVNIRVPSSSPTGSIGPLATKRHIPLDLFAWPVICLSAGSGALSFFRACAFSRDVIEEWVDETEEEFWTLLLVTSVFLLSSLLSLFQVIHIWTRKWRALFAFPPVLLMCICAWYLDDFRNTFQTIFHVIVSILAAVAVVRRRLKPLTASSII